MPLVETKPARTKAIALIGLRGLVVDVEASVTAQTPGTVLIGLPDASLGEARGRVRSAIEQSGVQWPARHLTINLSPASVPKHGATFDLAIALTVAVAAGVIEGERVANTVHLGELSLDGRLRPNYGVLPAVAAARDAGFERIVVPFANLAEAQLVEGIHVRGAASLAEMLHDYGAELTLPTSEPLPLPSRTESLPRTATSSGLDFADVVGNEEAVAAMECVAAGGHHAFLLGPPGSGKTMLSERLPGILPPLTTAQALDVAAIHSLTGTRATDRLDHTPPWEAPHHTATAISLVGGGTPIRPGALTRAHHGVLFLDEAPEFGRAVLDTLRQPLEAGGISIQRATHSAEFPTDFQLILAANPCPCGNYGSLTKTKTCECAPMTRRRYLARLSGPLLDRVDMHLNVAPQSAGALHTATPTTTSAAARARVMEARNRAGRRWAHHGYDRNARVPGALLRSGEFTFEEAAVELISRAVQRGLLSQRGADRVARVAWTLADLEAAVRPSAAHIQQALFYRKGPES